MARFALDHKNNSYLPTATNYQQAEMRFRKTTYSRLSLFSEGSYYWCNRYLDDRARNDLLSDSSDLVKPPMLHHTCLLVDS